MSFASKSLIWEIYCADKIAKITDFKKRRVTFFGHTVENAKIWQVVSRKLPLFRHYFHGR